MPFFIVLKLLVLLNSKKCANINLFSSPNKIFFEEKLKKPTLRYLLLTDNTTFLLFLRSFLIENYYSDVNPLSF